MPPNSDQKGTDRVIVPTPTQLGLHRDVVSIGGNQYIRVTRFLGSHTRFNGIYRVQFWRVSRYIDDITVTYREYVVNSEGLILHDGSECSSSPTGGTTG
jgi:hypothetical protein